MRGMCRDARERDTQPLTRSWAASFLHKTVSPLLFRPNRGRTKFFPPPLPLGLTRVKAVLLRAKQTAILPWCRGRRGLCSGQFCIDKRLASSCQIIPLIFLHIRNLRRAILAGTLTDRTTHSPPHTNDPCMARPWVMAGRENQNVKVSLHPCRILVPSKPRPLLKTSNFYIAQRLLFCANAYPKDGVLTCLESVDIGTFHFDFIWKYLLPKWCPGSLGPKTFKLRSRAFDQRSAILFFSNTIRRTLHDTGNARVQRSCSTNISKRSENWGLPFMSHQKYLTYQLNSRGIHDSYIRMKYNRYMTPRLIGSDRERSSSSHLVF
ncbi:hypothetical protein CPSG_01401 [Coccidioides posadasii str. Silveira]|uniref:Uncharacterized protein n=1 Tax=Coccidioides posadasii (strain RMSCC 757 / Silveira) TaxID=443226 RepID=E9CVA6_COCPS|nr:hypothetical protein CPSG_01401 [Coccidioides posadasii str. Silveira]